MESETTTRDARRHDLPAIAAIYGEAVVNGTGSFELEPPDATEMAERWRAVVEARLPWIVAERSGAVAGFAYAAPFRPRPGYRGTLASSVYVAPSARGQGVGRVLLDALLRAAEATGARQIVASVGDSANTASIRLHVAAGFERVGTVNSVGWKHNRWLDVVYMQRALGPGDSEPLD
ncbi:MAG: N-acetyltransferase family protein [Pseudomonadota bacterium]